MPSFKCKAKKFKLSHKESSRKKKSTKPKKSSHKSTKDNHKPVGDVYRFVEAQQNGIENNSKYRKYEGAKKTFQLDRKGDNIAIALGEIAETGIKKKGKHYIWYVFPQPEPKIKLRGISKTTKFFYITDDEVESFLRNSFLGSNLDMALGFLVDKGLDEIGLSLYFNYEAGKKKDNDKFYHFRIKFLEIIDKLLSEIHKSEKEFKVFLIRIKTNLEKLVIRI